MKKISVIIPIYNTKNELTRCLNSIVDQTYKNMEILCIDDGSTDGSELIVDEFSKKDNRIKVVHKKNEGESSARNVGLKMSTGEYIAFIDCDDWIDIDMYEKMVGVLESENVDMVAASWYLEEKMSTREIKNELPVKQSVFEKDDLLRYLYMRDSYRGFAYMWNKLYKRKLFYDKQGELILFDESLRIGGDVVYLAELALNVNKAKYIDRAFYHYNQREQSGCHTKDVKKLRDWIRGYEIIIQRFENECIDKDILDYVKRFLVYHSSNALEIAIVQGLEKEKNEFQGLMRQYEKEYVSLNTQYPDRIKRFFDLLSR